MKVLSIVNQKGGVGKTTTSINLSACLFKMKRRVLLVDLDPQSNATRGSGVDSSSLKSNVNDVLLGRVELKDSIIQSKSDGYDLLPSSPSLTESEVSLVTRDNREYILRRKLEAVTESYDYILMDCPPSLNILTVNSLVSATGVLIPVQCEFYALQGLSELINTNKNNIIFTGSATEAINLVASTFGQKYLKEGDEVELGIEGLGISKQKCLAHKNDN